MSPAKSSGSENIKADIVVIGGGGAGLAAAVAAAEGGVKNIVVLEERRRPGGNSVFPIAIFGTESPLHKRLGVTARNDDMFKKAMDYTHWKIEPRVVRTLINKSGDTIRWLEGMGVEFTWINTYYESMTSHRVKAPKRTGAEVVKALLRRCEKLGVRILCKTEAKKLLTSARKGVTGVLAEAEGKEIRITAKSVITATGGFAANDEMIKKYVPGYNKKGIHYVGIPQNGDGLRMVAEIGAATEDQVTLELGGPSFPWAPFLNSVVSKPNMVWVNKRGERFADETSAHLFAEGANSIYRQPDKTAYILFDEKIKQGIIAKEVGRDKNWGVILDTDLRLQADKGRVKISRSWGEIADWIGVASQVLEATIGGYNSSCGRGYDEIFVKDPECLIPLRTPPYYAIQCGLRLIITHGGIRINQLMEVLDSKDRPIPGLYAGGAETGGTECDTYNVGLAGHSFGFAVNTGRIAGENAAKYVLSNK